MEIFAGLALYTLVASLAGWLYCMIAMLNDINIIKWCKKNGISVESIPAMLIIFAFAWPITSSLLIGYVIYKIGRLVCITFSSLFTDLRRVIKKEK